MQKAVHYSFLLVSLNGKKGQILHCEYILNLSFTLVFFYFYFFSSILLRCLLLGCVLSPTINKPTDKGGGRDEVTFSARKSQTPNTSVS